MSNDYLMCTKDISYLKDYVNYVQDLYSEVGVNNGIYSGLPPTLGLSSYISMVTVREGQRPNMRGYKCAYNVDGNYFITREG